ncbi:YifB family Mg chelatase-like AAA ATPase [Brevibacterium paucivorans]|uniref:YifB family Mg chelatase-like AAA ATPase n=1 Tax=Brevibacterium paucivorans TaxID=170994 RepID=UPI0031D20DA7
MSLHVGRSTAVALWGTQGTPIAIEASINSGLPGIDVVGLPDTSVNEAKKRVRASAANLGFAMSAQRITVNLSPASVKKYGTNFDLGIAVAILQAERRIPQATDRVVFCAELGLDSRLHPVNGVVPTLIAAKQAGLTTVVVSQANEKEARMLTGLNVIAANSLGEVVNHFGGDVQVPQLPPVERHTTKARKPLSVNDLSEVQGQDEARYALEVAAAGGHHILMIGSPGAGKTMLAGCLPGLLPALSEEQAIETFSLRSIDGTLNPEFGLDTTPPFEAPHHSTTSAAMVGGSKPTSIGVFSRAHRGVLFMDEAPEFHRDVLEALRQPLENSRCEIGRAWGTVTLPADFQLVLAANPCPCGSAVGDGKACRCTPIAKRRYRDRLSGPLLDRIDIQMDMLPLSAADVHASEVRECTADVAVRVAEARRIQASRYAGQAWSTNARAPGSWLRALFAFTPQETAPLDAAMDRGDLTMRGYDRIVRIATTVADLGGRERPTGDDLAHAYTLRTREG